MSEPMYLGYAFFVDEKGRQLTLVDTGIGNKQSEKFFSHYFLHGDHSLEASLAVHGFNRDDITDVFLTHLHFDHGGRCKMEYRTHRLRTSLQKRQLLDQRAPLELGHQTQRRERASFLSENILPLQERGN